MLAVFLASVVQVTVGFGFSLLAVPIMALTLDIKQAVILATFLGLLSNSVQAWVGRREADRMLVRRLTLASFVGIPIGLLLFEQLNPDVLRGLLGIGVLWATYRLTRRDNAVNRGPLWDWLAGILSGALAASLSTNGPPLIFVIQSRQFPIAKFRATISTVFALIGLCTLASFVFTGHVDHDTLSQGLLALPVFGLGVLIGVRLRRQISEEKSRNLVFFFLGLAGVSALIGASVELF